MENLPCCNSVAGHQITTYFCTCHESTAAVSCTTFCNDNCIRIEVTMKRNFHQILIAMGEVLVKRDLDVDALIIGWLHVVVAYLLVLIPDRSVSWWSHQMKTFSALLGLCAGKSPVTGHRWISPTKARDADLRSLICAWTNGWVNSRDAGDLRSHRALMTSVWWMSLLTANNAAIHQQSNRHRYSICIVIWLNDRMEWVLRQLEAM